MNDNDTIRTLTDRFFDGDTTLSEERRLYDFYSREPQQLPADLRPLRQLFLDLAAAAPAPQVTLRPRWHRWAAAASLALLLAGGTLALTRPWHAADEEECVAYIYGERTTDRTQVLAEMQRTMSQAATPDGTADAVEQQLKAMFAND